MFARVGLRMESSVAAGCDTRSRTGSHIVNSAIDVLSRSVGQVADDRESRTTVRAVGECVPTTTVLGVENVLQAIVTGGEVGRDMHRRLAVLLGLDNLEVPVALRAEHFGLGCRR